MSRRLVFDLAAAGRRAGVLLTSAPRSGRSRPGWPLGQAPAEITGLCGGRTFALDQLRRDREPEQA